MDNFNTIQKEKEVVDGASRYLKATVAVFYRSAVFRYYLEVF